MGCGSWFMVPGFWFLVEPTFLTLASSPVKE
jgi:hypothetical protein